MGTSLVHDAFASGSGAASANRHRDHADHAWAIVCDGECSCNRPFANTGGTTRGMSEYNSRLNVTLAGGFDSAALAKLADTLHLETDPLQLGLSNSARAVPG